MSSPRKITQAAILCGGRGTRLTGSSEALPKPLVEIGGKPILWHVATIYAQQGISELVLCLGYQAERIERFVAETEWPAGVKIKSLDTGLDTPTGGRIKLAEQHLNHSSFFVTYADGVADIDLRQLEDFHLNHSGAASVTLVKPELQFGVAELSSEGKVTRFLEKPRSERWVNGGFFCFDQAVFSYLSKDSVLEREPLDSLARDGELHGFCHSGFWACMDTYKDADALNRLWETDNAAWRTW